MKKISLLISVTILSFLASSFLHVARDEIVILEYPTDQHAFIAESGVYFVDPWVDRVTIKMGYEKPTTQDYVNAMIKADQYKDAAFRVNGARNPATEEEVRRQVNQAVEYINARPEIAHPVILDDVEFFVPHPQAESRFDTELAHFDYTKGVVRYNMTMVREYARSGTNSLLAVTVHELVHSALGPFTGETLCQLLTLQVLHDMMEDRVSGSSYAFYEELQTWFWAAAKFRVEFNHGYYSLNLNQAWSTERYLNSKRGGSYTLETKDEQEFPRSWDTYNRRSIRVPYAIEYLKSLILGKPYRAKKGEPLYRDFTEKMVTLAYDIRVNGVEIKPGEIVRKLGIAEHLYKLHLPWQFWHNSIPLIHGERGYLKAGEDLVRAGEGRGADRITSFDDKLDDDPGYFAKVWWAYLYAPLQLIENSQFGDRYVGYYVLEKDIRTMTSMDWFFLNMFGEGIGGRVMQFEDIGPVMWKYLNPVPKPIVYQRECDGLWRIDFFYVEENLPDVRAFPLAPILLVLFWVAQNVSKKIIARVSPAYNRFWHIDFGQ